MIEMDAPAGSDKDIGYASLTKDGEAITPSSVLWTLTDDDGDVILEDQEAAAVASGTLTVPGASIKWKGAFRDAEYHLFVTVKISHGSGKTIVDQVRLNVLDTRGIAPAA